MRRRQPRPDKFCAGCAIKVCARQNKSGYCRRCLIIKVSAQPGILEKRRLATIEALKRPEIRAKMDAARARTRADPDVIERWRESGKRNYLRTVGSEKAKQANTSPEAIAKRVRTRTANMLAWCPPAYRERYLHRMMRIGAAEAKIETLAAAEADRITCLLTWDNLNLAADHLRRLAPVFKREDHWAYGAARLTDRELIERALLKGWSPPQPFRRAA